MEFFQIQYNLYISFAVILNQNDIQSNLKLSATYMIIFNKNLLLRPEPRRFLKNLLCDIVKILRLYK